MGKKIGHIALLILLLSQSFLSGFSNPPDIKAEKPEQDLIKQVTLLDEEGKIIDSSHPVNPDDVVNIQFDWSYTVGAVQTGKTDFVIPKELNVKEQKGSLLSGPNDEIGSFYVKEDRSVKMTFNEKAESHENAQGVFHIQAELNQEFIKGKDKAAIEFIIHGKSYVLNLTFAAPESAEEDNSETNSESASGEAEETESGAAENENEVDSKSTSKSSKANHVVTDSGADEQAQTKAAAASEITENIITSVIMKDENGEIIDAGENPDNQPSLGSAVEIEYTWKLENNHGYGAGSTFSFKLPDIFKVYNDVENEPLRFGGIDMGTFTVKTDGTVTMTFNEEIEKHSNIEGTLKLWTEFREEWKGPVEQEIVFPIKDGDSITIPVQFQPKPGPEIDKKGIPNKKYNAESIQWTVDFNKQLKKIKNAVLRDPIQAGQKLKADSIKVYKLDVQLDGSVKQGDLIDPSQYIIEKTDGNDFQIRFKSEQIDSAYRVVFVTDITDKDGTKYENKAVLTGDGVELPARASVSVNRGTPLSKKSADYDPKTQTITWEIQYNYNEKTISQKNAVLTDFFNKSQELISNSFEVYKVTIGEDGNEAGTEKVENYTVTPTSTENQNGFKLQFNEDIHSAYKIVYQTKATDRVFDWENITNKVVSGEGKEGEGSRDIHQQILIKANYPNHPETDYEKKTTTWGISFNNDSHLMKNVILKDVFTNKGLTFLPDTLKITAGNIQLEKGKDYHLIKEDDGFTIEFVHDISTPHYIEYQTKFDYDARGDAEKPFQNKATIHWKEKNDDSKSKDATANFDPDKYTKGNGFKNGSYNAVTKEITWNIGVNYNLKEVKNALVIDYILGNQKLMKDSIEVYEMELNGSANGVEKGNKLTLGKDFTIEDVKDEKGNPGFKINFSEDIETSYWITYKTSLQDQLIQKEYNNTAKLFSGDKEITSLDAKVSVAHGGEYTHKSGAQNGKVIDWKVNINFGQSKVTDATLTDDPSTNQILLENSFHLYGTKVAENGTVTKDPENELKRGEDYTLDIKTDDEGKQTFELKFSNDIDTAYILEYQSYINARNGDEITNKTSFDGKQITTEITDSEEKIIVKITGGSGSGSGETGSLEVTKVDASSGDVLKGATFTLYDSEEKIAIRTLTTGEDGKAVFKNLLYNDYVLKEDTAPEGYVVGIKDSKTVTIDSKDNNKVTVKNKKIVHAVELTKIDQETKETLSGAVFELQRKAGDKYEKVAELTTDENGVIFKDELEPGDYQFIEIKAPAGYQLNTEPIPFKIGEKQTEVVKKTADNLINLGAVELTKVDRDDQDTVLSGATFTLQDENGKVLQEGLTTNEEGKLIVKDLRPGKYQFVETKAPEHYKLADSPLPFEIVKDQIEVLKVTAENELIPGSVELIKVDKDNQAISLAGAEFELQDAAGKVIQTGLTTNEEGKLIVHDLKPGQYQFVETKAPKDYALESKPLPFEIEKGQKEVLLITVENELAPGSVELTKVDKDNKELTLSDAEFKLQTAEGKDLREGLKTDQEGKLVVKGLKPGKYQFVETKAPEHYNLDSTPLEFEIVRGQKETLQVTAYNRLIPGSVELTKVDQDNKDLPLSGAEFKLQTAEGKDIQEGLTTDAEGKLVVENLRPGKYQFVETKAPEYYQLSSKAIEFEIVKSQKEILAVTAENEFIRGKVELMKVDKDNKNVPLPGVEFALQNADGKTLQEGLTTDKDGKITIEDLKPGDYQFVETKPLFGYEPHKTPITFTIEKSKTEADVELLKITAENELATGSVELTKVDVDHHNAPLAGAEFELQDVKGNPLQSGLSTNKEGKLVVKDLKPGKYQFVETKAPFGYNLDPTPIEFTIEKGQTKAVTVTAHNDLTTGSVQLIKVDKDDNELTLEGAEFVLQTADGQKLKEGLTTGKDGKLVVNDLKPGDYQFVETKAPYGYGLDQTPIKFTIEKGQVGIVIKVALNELTPGSVELIKVDKDNKKLTLEGAEFALQDANGKTLQAGLTTNKNGKLIVNNLKPGQYQFVETKAPEHYQLDSNPIKFLIEKGQKVTLTVTAENELIPGSVELLKVDKDNHELALPGAKFELQDSEGKTLLAKLATDQNGKLVINNLKPGKYQFVETEAPEFYQLSSKPIEFEIVKSQKEKLAITIENELIRGTVELTKVDADNEKAPLAAAVFDLQDTEGNTLREGLTTGKDGKITVTDLKPGDYQFVETKAPFGYKLDKTPVTFTIEKHKTEADLQLVKVTAENELTPGSVELTKVDADDDKVLLADTEFELQSAKGHPLQSGLTTNKEGKLVVNNLKPGKYQFVETKAPEHYKLDAVPIAFEIEKGQKEVLQITAYNELTPGAVELTKVDTDSEELTLSGAEFKLQTAEGEDLQTELRTNEAGKLFVKDLKPGKYQFVETKAPEHYKLDAAPIVFEIEKGQKEVLQITAHNELIPGAVELTKVDTDSEELTLSGAEFKLQTAEGEDLQTELRTNEAGKLFVKDLKPGKYQFVETKAPEHYKLDAAPIVFEIEKGQKEVLQITAHNELIPGAVELTKVDTDSEELTLSGAEFKLQTAEGEDLQTELRTNEAGKLFVKDLKPGKYQFVETKAPEHYKLDAAPIAFEIEKGQKEVLQITAYNELTPGAVELTKVDKDNEELTLSGAEFKLQTAEGEDLQTELRTNGAGKLFVKDLKPGKYQFVETKAPEHYKLDAAPIAFEIEKGQKEVLQITAYNELTPGAVELTKIDKDDPALTLPGAVFELQDKEGRTLQAGLTTDKGGKIIVGGLKPGDYQFVEKEAPKGYQKRTEPVTFTIGKGQVKQKIKVTNAKVPVKGEEHNEPGTPVRPNEPSNPIKHPEKQTGGMKLPNTATAIFNYAAAGVILLLVGILLTRFRRNRQE